MCKKQFIVIVYSTYCILYLMSEVYWLQTCQSLKRRFPLCSTLKHRFYFTRLDIILSILNSTWMYSTLVYTLIHKSDWVLDNLGIVWIWYRQMLVQLRSVSTSLETFSVKTFRLFCVSQSYWFIIFWYIIKIYKSVTGKETIFFPNFSYLTQESNKVKIYHLF